MPHATVVFRSTWAALLVNLFLASGSALAEDNLKLPLEISVTAGPRDRTDALVSLPLAAIKQARQPLRLVETTNGNETPVSVQVDQEDACLWWVASGRTPQDK